MNKIIQLKLIYIATILFLGCHILSAQTINNNWIVLKTYDQDHTDRIAMPIGGIGTGTISLTGRGALEDWEIMSHPAKGTR